MPASTYLRGKIIDHVLRATAFGSPTTVYVSLHTSDPTVAGTPATEVSASWYSRLAAAFAAQVTAGQTANSGTLTFNAVTGSSVTITHFAIWDSPTLGNMLGYAALSAPKTFAVNDVPSWLPSSLAVALT